MTPNTRFALCRSRTIVTRTMPRAGGHDDHPHVSLFVFRLVALDTCKTFVRRLCLGGGLVGFVAQLA